MIKLLFDCPENLNSHPTTQKGHFCNTCKKEVVDFTKYTATEIKNHFQNFPERTCGSFNKNQIESSLNARLSSLFRVAFGLVFFLGLSSSQLMGQEPQHVGQPSPIETGQLVVSGQITSNGEPLPFVKIILYSGQTQLAIGLSDIEGHYKISAPDSLLNTDLRITFKSVGHNDQEVYFNPAGVSVISINQELTPSEHQKLIVGLIIYEPNLLIRNPDDFGKTTISGDDLKYGQR